MSLKLNILKYIRRVVFWEGFKEGEVNRNMGSKIYVLLL